MCCMMYVMCIAIHVYWYVPVHVYTCTTHITYIHTYMYTVYRNLIKQ